jgi:hypothetical protein
MMIMNGIHTCCVDVVYEDEMIQFVEESSMIMTGFVSMAAGKIMKFPTAKLIGTIKKEFEGKNQDDKILRPLFILKIKEMLIYNHFELYANMILDDSKESLMVDTNFMENCKKILIFSAIPEGE